MQKAMIAAISMVLVLPKLPRLNLPNRLTDRLLYTNIRSMPVACALAPDSGCWTALGDGRSEMLRRPAALAPEPGAAQLIGEVSGPAERLGVRAGMRLGEALSRCPELALIPPDPERAERAWEGTLRRFESGVGAEVESERPGEAFFEAGGLRRLWGGIDGRARPLTRGRPASRCGSPRRRGASAPTPPRRPARCREPCAAVIVPEPAPRGGSSPRCRSRC